MTTKPKRPWPVEPVLDMADIQGIAVPGFFKPHQVLLGLLYQRTPERLEALLGFLRDLTPQVSSAAVTLRDRRDFRSGARKTRTKRFPLIAIGFSFHGLFDLTPGADAIPSPAFKNGLARRSALLGDPTDPKSPGHPNNWRVGGPTTELDILIIVAGDTKAAAAACAAKLEKALKAIKVRVVREVGGVRTDVPGEKGHEHSASTMAYLSLEFAAGLRTIPGISLRPATSIDQSFRRRRCSAMRARIWCGRASS